ncbi:MAG: hypothetical protein DI630_36300 [Gordonia sp. (in: high G+C Gram-positive bacteria)]|nr:MAG: hypothetical protein DI630_36300 [Gordonia sp. (in: high G+C Gram-positive bacteria)]
MGTMRSQRGPKRTSLAERPNDGDRLELLDEGTYFARVDSLVRGEPPLATLDMVSSEGWDPRERGETTLSGAVRAFWRRWEENAVLGVENPLEQFTVRLADVHVDEPRSWDEWFENASWLTVIVRAAQPTDGPISSGNFDIAETEPAAARALNKIFSMDLWPSTAAQRVERVLESIHPLDHLVVQDVGQGSTNSLSSLESGADGDDKGMATVGLFIDVGASIARASLPAHLDYCTCASPLVILTHWDRDHWKGADLDPNLRTLTWIAPRQQISPTHSKHAARILANGGRLLIVKRSSRPIVMLRGQHQQIDVRYCSGNPNTRNHSGLAVQVYSSVTDSTWVFPGDCDYRFLPPITTPVSALVASHHGAKVLGTPPVRPADRDYVRLVYSYGVPNSYGHPTASAVAKHRGEGWQHNGSPLDLDSLDTRTTAGDGTSPRASIAIGWVGAPTALDHHRQQHGLTLRT